MKKNLFSKISSIFFCIIILACVIWLIYLYKPAKNPYTEYKATTANTEATETSDLRPDNPIDFASLQKTNIDVYAWITIPGTDVDYPVVQSSSDKDDNFYLDHNIDQKYEFAGMIYSQRLNAKDFKDPVTVLYGHNMLNGSMFATLHRFEDEKFFKKHDSIIVYTPGHQLTYKIVSAYVYDNRHILNTFNFSKKKDLKDYIESLTHPKSMVAKVRDNLKVTTKDHILTLSTCTSSDTQRYLVQGVLTDDTITK